MKKSGFTMYKMLMMFALIPLVTSLFLLTLFSIFYVRENLESQTKNTLHVAALDLAEYYNYDLATGNDLVDGWIAYDPDYLDHLTPAEVDLTIFRGDTRFCTSIVGSDGKRIEGTKASDAVIEEVLNKGNEYYSDDVVINDIDYYVYYVPLKDGKGNIVGMAFAGKTCDIVYSTINRMIWILVVIALFLLVVFVALCLYFAHMVTKPIKAVSDTITRLSEGDLSTGNEAVSKIDETRSLIYASHLLRDKLNEIMSSVKSIGGELNVDAGNVNNMSEVSAQSINQISSAMEDLAHGATEMAEDVQEIGQQVANLNETIELLSENSEALAISSGTIRTSNDDARKYIDRVSETSVQSVEAVTNIKDQISETNDAVQKIREAVEMITSIASQTNLLALNASIEAARAGEAGRGFAVVATEIGNLSDQSSKSANEIKKIVDEIVRKSEASVELSGNVAELIREEQSFIKETQAKFVTLGKEISGSLERIEMVTDNARELEKIQNIITDAVQSLSAISEENAASNQEVSASITGIASSIQEIASSADSNKNKSDRLVNEVSYFT